MKRILATAVLMFVAVSCTQTSGPGACPTPPALAAGDLQILALSCAEEVSWNGRPYSVSGGDFHESWVGEKIAGQGETDYTAVYRLLTYSPEEVIVLEAQRRGKTRLFMAFAHVNTWNRADDKKVALPFGSGSKKDTGIFAEVLSTVSQIQAAAEENDYEALRDIIEPDLFLSDFGFGSEVPDPAAAWEQDGPLALEVMKAVLEMDHVAERGNEGLVYRWPIYDAETKSMKEISPNDLRLFRSALGPTKAKALVPNHEYGYVGPRLGIRADGTWMYFVMSFTP